MSVHYCIEICDGWMLERQLADEEWDLLDEAGDWTSYAPMTAGTPIFFGRSVSLGGYDAEEFVMDADDLMPSGEVPDPPFTPEEWVRGKWIMGFYA